jgi:S1-C subfamily serine protease
VGSGVIVFNAERGSPKVLETYVLTAYHVIKDNFVTKEGEKEPVQVDIYPRKNDRITVISEVLQVQTELDVALLRIRTNLIANPAKPADPEILAGLDLFSKVVTIGCPLGYEPMPTRGELMSRSKVFDKRTFWMMSAPTIFGNSGGGVFDAGSGCLLGLLVRIAAYKNVIDVAVPHLGIVTPIAEIENWLEKTGFGFVLKTGSRLDAKPLDASQGKK